MTPDNFSTHSLSPRDQLEAWREWFEPVLDVLPKHAASDEFPAEIHLWKLGGLAMSRTSAPPANVARTKAPQARAGRSLGHQLLCAGRALRRDGGNRTRSTSQGALPLVVGTRVLA
jgi:hypothetical protein